LRFFGSRILYMPSVTTVVPTCNRPVLLRRALSSIAAQEIPPAEVIVVDDGDVANEHITRDAAEQSGLKGILVVANSHAKGASGARNTGAAHATCEILAFLDDDDEWLPSYLSQAVGQLDWSKLDVVCTDLLCQFDDGVDRLSKSAPDRLAPDLFLTRNPGLGGSNLIIRRSLYCEIDGFDESLPSCNDKDFGIRLSLHGGVRYLNLQQRLVRFYQHTGPKLGTPASEAMRVGIRRFYDLHARRMNETQRQQYRDMARRFFSVDERGQILDVARSEFFDPLFPLLKARLDQQRGRVDK
jgi:glycosyltransferase involved in cell wall biosynthesis